MTPNQLILPFMYFFIILVILPIFCNEKIYSVFYEENIDKVQYDERINVEHRVKGVKEYLQKTDSLASLQYHEAKLQNPIDNLIIILTKRPAHEEDLVLSQLVTEVDRSIRAEKFFKNALMICNATRVNFNELNLIAEYYPVSQGKNSTTWKLFNSEEIIKHDFVECITHALDQTKADHVTIIRDSVVPYSGFLNPLNFIIRTRLNGSILRGDLRQPETSWLFLHLHEPVPNRHYEFSFICVYELLLITSAGAAVFYLIFPYVDGRNVNSSQTLIYAFYGALYFFTFALLIGRPYVSELRRTAFATYRIYDPPSPIHFSAIALPSTSARSLIELLNDLQCSSYTPFHHVLDHMVNTMELPGYVVSPSLVRYVARS